MYYSNSSLNGNNLISYPNQAFSTGPVSFESNPSSKDESNCPFPLPPPLSFFPFHSSPFEDNQFFLEQHYDYSILPEVDLNMEASINTKIPEQVPRKRSSKRDRHSKIKTARGLRDRRMRLSLEVAKKFFGLQDMLGFDKASKTVEWLLNQAKVEIKQVAREKNHHHQSCSSVGAKSASSTSECEGVSGLDEVVVSGNQEQEGEPQVKRRMIKPSRKSAFNPIGREKARERARDRTREKLRQNLNLLRSWNPLETVEESVHQSQSVNPSMDVLAGAEEPTSHSKDHSGTVHEDSLLIMSPTMMFNYNSGIPQEHQFGEFQSLGKPWEAYNNRI